MMDRTCFDTLLQLCPLIMVVMKSQYAYDDLALINYYIYQVFAPDLQIGHVMDPAKRSQAFTFLSGSLALARGGLDFPEAEFTRLLRVFPDMAEFVRSSPIPFCSPTCGRLPMKIFSDAFEIVLDSDFATIFQTIGLDQASGIPSLRDEELVSRTDEPLPDGMILGVPAEDHFRELLYTNANAGTADMMIVTRGTIGFIESMDRNDTDSVNTGPYPVIGSPEEILQMRR